MTAANQGSPLREIAGFVIEESFAEELERGLIDYMTGLFESEYAVEAGEDPPEPLSGEPFCGCDVCERREALVFITQQVLLGVRDKRVWLAP
jgi:hypothetical protein